MTGKETDPNPTEATGAVFITNFNQIIYNGRSRDTQFNRCTQILL